MEVKITISDTAAENIRGKSVENGTTVDDFVESFVEKTFANGNGDRQIHHHNLLAFAGKFSSGKTDTSERMSEILQETDFDPAEGFSIR